MRHLSWLLLCFCPSLTWALSDAQTIPLLHAMGEYRAAYPLAINEAKRLNTVAAWAAVYQQPEYAKLTAPLAQDAVYAQAWQAAQAKPQIDAYRQFIALEPGSRGAQLALDGEYQLVKQQNTLAAYAEFMAAHPDAVQSLDALLHVQRLAWEQVKAKNTVAEYDKYLDAFPDAPFAPEAEQAAQALTVRPYQERWAQCDQEATKLREENQSRGEVTAKREAEQMRKECREDMARELFNTARKSQAARAGLRLYALLDGEAYAHTKVMTEHLDRQERQTHQAKLESLLNQQLEQTKAQATQLLAALETQTQRLEAGMERQTQRLEAAIQQQQQNLQQELTRIRQQVSAGPEVASELRRAVVQRGVSAAVPLVKRVACVAASFIPIVGRLLSSACNSL